MPSYVILVETGSQTESHRTTQPQPPDLVVSSATLSSTRDPSVSVWTNPSNGRMIYILGTTHISDSSAQLARALVADVRPDAVFIELDASRLVSSGNNNNHGGGGDGAGGGRSDTHTNATTGSTTGASQQSARGGQQGSGSGSGSDHEPTETTTPENEGPPPLALSCAHPNSTISSSSSTTTSSSSTASTGMDLEQQRTRRASAAVGTAIEGMYTRLNQSGFTVGDDFAIAIQEAWRVGSTVILGDRDLQVTLQRVAAALARTDLQALLQPNSEIEQTVAGITRRPLPNSSSRDPASFKAAMSAYVETMQARENVKLLMVQLKRAAPELYGALVEERDEYMAEGLERSGIFPTIVAVMGIAHVEGVETNLMARGWVPADRTATSAAHKTASV